MVYPKKENDLPQKNARSSMSKNDGNIGRASKVSGNIHKNFRDSLFFEIVAFFCGHSIRVSGVIPPPPGAGSDGGGRR